MALNLHRPMLRSVLHPPTCRIPIRTFTNTSTQSARRTSGQIEGESMTVAGKKQMANAANIPNDLGLLPDTLVMPTGPKAPGIFRAPQKRAMLEWQRVRRRVLDLVSVLYYKFFIINKSKMGLDRPTINFGKTKGIARELHHEMYSAFAEGDVPALRKVCATGLFTTFSSRISKRPRNEKWEWNVERYIGQPKVVSHRVAMLPSPPMTTLRQAVVRIRSRQKLEKVKVQPAGGKVRSRPAQAERVEETAAPKDVTEYLVLQKMMVQGKEGPWMVWGTTQETDTEQLLGA